MAKHFRKNQGMVSAPIFLARHTFWESLIMVDIPYWKIQRACSSARFASFISKVSSFSTTVLIKRGGTDARLL